MQIADPLYTAGMTDHQRAWFYAEYERPHKDEVVGFLLALILGNFGALTTSTCIETPPESCISSSSGPASPRSSASSSAFSCRAAFASTTPLRSYTSPARSWPTQTLTPTRLLQSHTALLATTPSSLPLRSAPTAERQSLTTSSAPNQQSNQPYLLRVARKRAPSRALSSSTSRIFTGPSRCLYAGVMLHCGFISSGKV